MLTRARSKVTWAAAGIAVLAALGLAVPAFTAAASTAAAPACGDITLPLTHNHIPLALDVFQQTAAPNQPLKTWPLNTSFASDPAEQFTLAPATDPAGTANGAFQIVYTPYCTQAAAAAAHSPLAATAYSTAGAPLYCVSGITAFNNSGGVGGSYDRLRLCAATPAITSPPKPATAGNMWQDFYLVAAGDGFSQLEWNAGLTTEQTVNGCLGLNDARYSDPSGQIINWNPAASANMIWEGPALAGLSSATAAGVCGTTRIPAA